MRASWLVVLIVAGPAHADERAPADVPITYRGPSSCPPAAAFRLALAKRTTSRRRPEADHVRSFDINIVSNARGYSGRLSTHDDGDHVTEREVTAPTCTEVVEAVAFFCAVALGFDALSEEEPVAPAPLPPPPRPEVPKAHLSAARLRVSMSVGADAASDVIAPHVRPAAGAFLSFGLHSPWWFDPEARLGFITTSSDTFTSPSGSASVTLMAARLDLCPLGVHLGAAEARLCAAVQAGALTAQGGIAGNAHQETLPWVTIGPLVRLALTVVGPLALEMEGALSLATARHRFYFLPDETIYQTPIVGEWLGGGLRVTFL